jgi:hypothetical protein
LRPACYERVTNRKNDMNRKAYRLSNDKPRHERPKTPSAPIHYQFVVYRINIDHESINKFFTQDSPRTIVTNIIPSNWNVFPGCKYTLFSNNELYHTRFETTFEIIPGTRQGRGRRATYAYQPVAKFGIYQNSRENIRNMCKQKRIPQRSRPMASVVSAGYPIRLMIDGNMLKMYTAEDKPPPVPTDEEVTWSIQIAKEGAKQPIALVLLDTGRFGVYDMDNNSVIAPSFEAYINASLSNNNAPVPPVASSGEYDPEEDYKNRLAQLRAWLIMSNLLVEVSEVYDIRSADIVRITGGEATPDQYGNFQPFDLNIDYMKRLSELVSFMKKQGYNVNANITVETSPVTSNSGTSKTIDTSMPSVPSVSGAAPGVPGVPGVPGTPNVPKAPNMSSYLTTDDDELSEMSWDPNKTADINMDVNVNGPNINTGAYKDKKFISYFSKPKEQPYIGEQFAEYDPAADFQTRLNQLNQILGLVSS